jgi:hypothetical protein
MNIGDDGVEKLDAAFHIRPMSRSPADGNCAPYEEIKIVVGEDFGIELANIGGILECSEHVGDFWGWIGGTPLPVGFTPRATEGIATGLKAAVQGSQDEGDHSRLAGIDVASIVGEGGNDFKSPVEEAVVLAQTGSVKEEGALDAGQVGQGRAALQKLVPHLGDIVWLFGKEQVAGDRPQPQYVLHRVRLEDVAYLVHGHGPFGEWTIPVQLLDEAVKFGRSARHRLARPLACDLADALEGTVG